MVKIKKSLMGIEMKLIFCPDCSDIIKIREEKTRYCHCEKSWGVCLDKLNVEIGGKAVPLGINNSDFLRALNMRSEDNGWGETFEAFIIPKKCKTVQEE